MHYMKAIFSQLIHLMNYFYYIFTSIFKNVHPYRFVGESLRSVGEYKVKIKMAGKTNVMVINVTDFIINKGLIDHFSPVDALQIGKILFKQMIFDLSENMRVVKFCEMKKTMISNNQEIKLQTSNTNSTNLIKLPEFNQFQIRNFYPFKLVALTSDPHDFNTKIRYSSLNKREAYEKSLNEVIEDATFVTKFNPMTALKLGFIHFGDSLFASGEI